MEPKDGKGPGDGSAPKKKKTPTARKRTAKTAKSAEQSAPALERQAEPAAGSRPQEQADGTERNPKDSGISRPRAADQPDPDDNGFGETQADRAAQLAADLKSWMDTRGEDRDERGEVL